MDTFWIMKSLTNKISALLSSFHTTDDNIELKSLSPGVSFISRQNDQRENNGCE